MSDFEYVRKGITKDEQPFCLRPAQREDTDQIVANICEVCAEQIYLTTDTFIMIPEWNRILTRSVNEDNGNLLVVAEVQSKVVGHLRLFTPWYGLRGGHVGEVGISLIARWREKGVGKALLSYIVEWAEYVKLRKLSASIFSTNQRALNLFLTYNFVEEGYRPNQFLVEGQYIDEVLMGRSI